MLRLALFMAANLAVMLVLAVAAYLIAGLPGIVAAAPTLGVLTLVGAVCSAVSLYLQRAIAVWRVNALVISGTEGMTEAWLVDCVQGLAELAKIPTPSIAIFDAAPNAFTVGASKGGALIAVSTGLLRVMDRTQIKAVLAHEVGHIANGDALTLALLQGVLTAYVRGPATILGFGIDRFLLKNKGNQPGAATYLLNLAFERSVGLLAVPLVAKFSRNREFRADAVAARLLSNSEAMQSALTTLEQVTTRKLPGNLAALGIAGAFNGWAASHPPIEHRVNALLRAAVQEL